jgi:tetratricopeptide (TPR) repeat protein
VAGDLRLLVKADARPAWRRDFASAMLRLARIQLRLGHTAQARTSAEESLVNIDAVSAAQPRDLQSRRVLCEALLAAGSLDDAAGRHPRAVERWTRALALSAPADRDAGLSALRLRLLAALGRADEAIPLARTLLAGGYRDPDFLAAVAALPPSPALSRPTS